LATSSRNERQLSDKRRLLRNDRNEGAKLPTIQRISGHKTLAMVMRYVHLSDERIDSSITAIDTGFLDAITLELHTPGQSPEIGKAKVARIPYSKPIR
jgi:hypothetical protein